MQGPDGKWMTGDDGLHLISTSTAYNAGNNGATGIPSTDITGAARIQNTTVEMGAYEGTFTIVPVTLISFTGLLQNGKAQLQWLTATEDNFNHLNYNKVLMHKPINL
ncbi:MAG: choice-of-anchor Q domain-containing protein [Ferruginibacter sp.]